MFLVSGLNLSARLQLCIEQRSSCGTVLGATDKNEIWKVAGLIGLFFRHEYSIFEYSVYF